jgi:beta-glucosidase
MDPTRPIALRVDDLLAQMTLAEKVAQLGSVYIYDLLDERRISEEKARRLAEGIGQITRLGTYTLLTPRQRAEMANAIQSYLVNQTRLGIPAIFHDECCAGFIAALGATRFPQMIGLASTFRPELARRWAMKSASRCAPPARTRALGPCWTSTRDPRWGRVEETFGEDPSLVARFGVGYVRGLQGGNLKDGVMATGKHFLGHSVSDGGLNCTPVHLGPREIREVFLLPYEAAVREAGLATMMNSYSEMDGRSWRPIKPSCAIYCAKNWALMGWSFRTIWQYEMLHTFPPRRCRSTRGSGQGAAGRHRPGTARNTLLRRAAAGCAGMR